MVEDDGGLPRSTAPQVHRELGKMGKSLKNAVAPDEMCERYGADTLRLYEMFSGPLDQSRPWDTTAVVGMYRLLQRIWRVVVDEETGAARVADVDPDDDTLRVLHRTIAVGARRHGDAAVQHLDRPHHRADQPPDLGLPRRRRAPGGGRAAGAAAGAGRPPRGRGAVVPPGPRGAPWPTSPTPMADEAWLVDDTVEVPVQVNGKVRGRISVPADADQEALEAAARADAKVAALLDGATVRKVDRRPRPHGQLRRRLTPLPPEASASPTLGGADTATATNLRHMRDKTALICRRNA